MTTIQLRTMEPADWTEVADLIYDSTNAWCETNGRPRMFTRPKGSTRLFCSVYEDLDPGCCVVAEDSDAGRLAGSCFYHPRPTHVSLGIMNVHPGYFRQGVARRLLKHITDFADEEGKPVRLVSSALNLDSFSLYTKAGFIPRTIYQDMTLKVPDEGLAVDPLADAAIRDARLDDVPAMAALEMEINHIRRGKDFRYFVENSDGKWHVSVLENEQGGLDGFLVSVVDAAINMLGPGIARTERQAAVLIHAELNHHRGRQPLWLVPSQCDELVRTMYEWGAVNCELHLAQTRGAWTPPSGIAMPTFMPETA